MYEEEITLNYMAMDYAIEILEREEVDAYVVIDVNTDASKVLVYKANKQDLITDLKTLDVSTVKARHSEGGLYFGDIHACEFADD